MFTHFIHILPNILSHLPLHAQFNGILFLIHTVDVELTYHLEGFYEV